MIYFYNDKEIFEKVVLKEINNSQNKDKLHELILRKQNEFNSLKNNNLYVTKDAPENIEESKLKYEINKGNVDNNDEIKYSLINEQKNDLNCAPIISNKNKIVNKDDDQINYINNENSQFKNNISINKENAQIQNFNNNNKYYNINNNNNNYIDNKINNNKNDINIINNNINNNNDNNKINNNYIDNDLNNNKNNINTINNNDNNNNNNDNNKINNNCNDNNINNNKNDINVKNYCSNNIKNYNNNNYDYDDINNNPIDINDDNYNSNSIINNIINHSNSNIEVEKYGDTKFVFSNNLKEDKNTSEKNVLLGVNMDNNKNDLIKEFRKMFDLHEEDYSDERLLNALEKSNNDFNKAFESFFQSGE